MMKGKSNPILSIVIATKNRYQYLKGCLKATCRIFSDEFEIIVQDNTEKNDEILSFLQELNDDRVKYFHIGDPISVSENYNQAMCHASGEYVCMLGDDDTIVGNIIYAAQFCHKNKIEACNFLMAGFNWPDMIFKGKQKEANLFYNKQATGIVQPIDAKKELEFAVLSAYGLSVTMPRAYHGLISKECMDKVFQKTGTYFPGPSPDMANGAAVCLVSEKSVLINDYLIVSGYGYNSARGEGNRRQHYGRLDEKPWLPKDILEKWDKELPPIFSGETITAQSLLEALESMGSLELKKNYNYAGLYALFLYHNKQAIKEFIFWGVNRPIRLLRAAKGILDHVWIRIRNKKAGRSAAYFQEFFGVTTLEEAQDYTEKLREKLKIVKYEMGDKLLPPWQR